jgi:hypothetical protein
VVQKARELRGALAEADAREKAEEERAVRERSERQQKEREGILRKESALLLAQFDQTPLDFEKLSDADIAFSVFDPLNFAGSVVLNQQPDDDLHDHWITSV